MTAANVMRFAIALAGTLTPAADGTSFTAIPYPAWAHRGKGEMTVWLRRAAK